MCKLNFVDLITISLSVSALIISLIKFTVKKFWSSFYKTIKIFSNKDLYIWMLGLNLCEQFLTKKYHVLVKNRKKVVFKTLHEILHIIKNFIENTEEGKIFFKNNNDNSLHDLIMASEKVKLLCNKFSFINTQLHLYAKHKKYFCKSLNIIC